MSTDRDKQKKSDFIPRKISFPSYLTVLIFCKNTQYVKYKDLT